MDYGTVIAAYFDPAAAELPTPAPVSAGAPARQLRDAFEPLSMHAVWSPLVHERLGARGLDFFGTYVGGRGCVLGDPNGAVVASAFAAFEPSMIAGVWDQARSHVGVVDLREATFSSTAESLRSVLGDDPAVASVADQLSDIVAGLDPTGRPLFSGVQALEAAEDPHERLWRSCLALREHRGDAHVAVYISDGFDPVQMNILTELWLDYPFGEYSSSRAWPEDRTEAALASLEARGLTDSDRRITDAGRRRRSELEDRTDAMEDGVVAGVGADFEAICAQLEAWSAQCIEARTFPPDPRKRAAG